MFTFTYQQINNITSSSPEEKKLKIENKYSLYILVATYLPVVL